MEQFENLAKEFYLEYNRQMRQGLEDLIPEEKILSSLRDDEIDEMLKNSVETEKDRMTYWIGEPLDKLQGKSPYEFIEQIDEFKKIKVLFEEGAKICEYGLETLLLDKMRSFGKEAEEYLFSIVSDGRNADEQSEKYLLLLESIVFLPDLKVHGGDECLLELFDAIGENSETVLERIQDALAGYGPKACGLVISRIENSEQLQKKEEYLLQTLVKIGTESPSDIIYRCLRDCFRRMEDKRIGAICLADYGDRRAVSALRGYLKRNLDNVDKETFYDIKYAVEKLGGSMEDIKLLR